jgi:hypothetical protein
MSTRSPSARVEAVLGNGKAGGRCSVLVVRIAYSAKQDLAQHLDE